MILAKADHARQRGSFSEIATIKKYGQPCWLPESLWTQGRDKLCPEIFLTGRWKKNF
ncbi:MAG: hypothetical protein WBV94_12915 [Blastocatellia bacterium]